MIGGSSGRGGGAGRCARTRLVERPGYYDVAGGGGSAGQT